MNPKTAKDAQTKGPEAPDPADEAVVADPGEQEELNAGQEESQQDSQSGQEEEDDDEEAHWLGIELKDADGNPVPHERYLVKLADGTQISGWLDEKGKARVEGLPADCNPEISFPKLHKDDVKSK